MEEVGIVKSISGNKAPSISVGDVIIRIDSRYFRPAEVDSLLGSPKKAKEKLGWTPEINAKEMCAEMIHEDLLSAKRNAFLIKNGHKLTIPME